MNTPTHHDTRHGDWDDETIQKFWGYWSHRGDRENWYFSKQFATALVHLAEWSGHLSGRVLDYGCALGDLCCELVNHPVEVEAVEFSQQSLDVVQEKLESFPNWKGGTLITGTPTPLPAGQFDLIFCVEVVEHLRNEWLFQTIDELHRLLKPGGTLILTTPCEEDIGAAETFCPFCSTEFHPAQHVRSIAPEALNRWLVDAGLDVTFCKGIDLRNLQDRLSIPPLVDWSINNLKRPLGFGALGLLDALSPRSGWNRRFKRATRLTGPHLCAIARKPS